MAGQIGSIVAKKGAQLATKKFLDKQLNDNKDRAPGGPWDPYFEYRPNKRGKMKKVRKQIPAYIPPHDAEILAKVRKWAYRLDVKMSFMGMRFGWGALIGLIPELGDAIDTLLSLYIYQKCRKIEGGLDTKTKTKMKMWILTDTFVGLVPFVGDIIDASIKCNARNCRLLEEFLDAKYKPKELIREHESRSRDPHYHPPAPATVYEDFSEDDAHYYSSREDSPHGRHQEKRRDHHDPPRDRRHGDGERRRK